MIKKLIEDCHAKKIIPVLSLSAHSTILNEYIEGFEDAPDLSLKRFAKINGFIVTEQDYAQRYSFSPKERPEDYDRWERKYVTSRTKQSYD